MTAAARPSPIPPAMLFMLAVTLWRTLWLTQDATDLYVDEAQYWLWGQRLDFGYYSKPPLIGWLIRAVTDLAGSDSTFWVRFPGAWLHLATGLGVIALARFWTDARTAAWAGALWITLPGVSVGSALISTDTVLLPFCALGLYAWSRLTEARSVPFAVLLGAALGLGAMAKYAAVFLLPPAVLVALLLPGFRIAWRDAAIALAVGLLMFAPNIWWNLTHDLTTVQHTADNARWGAARFSLGGAAKFFGGQFGVMGPVAFALYLAAVLRWSSGLRVFLILFSLPIILFITLQAFISQANANWAAPAYVAACVLVAISFPRRWLALAVGVNLVLALALPVAVANAGWLTGPNGKPLLVRYLGIAELSEEVFARAEVLGQTAIVTDNRGLAADLNYRRGERAVALYSAQRPGFAASYYEQEFPVPADPRATALWVSFDKLPLCLPKALAGKPAFALELTEGFRAGQTLRGFIAPLVCEVDQ